MRIVQGVFGGRRLVAPKGQATRPTADRAKEALFSVLFDVTDAVVLDLFAGSGALGLEALSRGARHATFVESNRQAIAALRANVDALGVDATILTLDVRRALPTLARAESRFDLVFADPPYDLAPLVMPSILAALPPSLADGARIVVEHRHSDPSPTPPPQIVHTQTRRYGEAALAFYEKGA